MSKKKEAITIRKCLKRWHIASLIQTSILITSLFETLFVVMIESAHLGVFDKILVKQKVSKKLCTH